jgi:hypothetical protein
MMMASFIGILAAPATQSIFKNKETRNTMPIRLLYSVVGWWLYQQAALLGYSLREERRILERILKLATDDSIDDINIYRNQVAKDLEETKTQQKHFYCLYSNLEMSRVGLNHSEPKAPELSQEIDLKYSKNVMRDAFYKGAALGFHFPDEFSRYWQGTYQLGEINKPPDKGDKSQSIYKDINLRENVVRILNMVLDWNQLEGYEVLNTSDSDVIEQLIYKLGSEYKNR